MLGFSPKRRRGNALVWTTVCMVPLIGVCSLGVDWGRVQVAKKELQAAADAAAMAAGDEMVSAKLFSTATATSRAIAAANRADGRSVLVTPSDIEFGTWVSATQTFTPGGYSPNAVRVTATYSQNRGNPVPLLFASIIGYSTADVSARSTVAVLRDLSPISAKHDITINQYAALDQERNVSQIKSTHSGFGAYGTSLPTTSGSLAANNAIEFYNYPINHAPVDAQHALGMQLSGGIWDQDGTFTYYAYTGNAYLTYSTGDRSGNSTLSTPLTYAAKNPDASLQSQGNVVLNSGRTTVYQAGNYVFDSLDITNGSVLQFDGPSTVYIRNSLNVVNSAMVTTSNQPSDLQIHMADSGGRHRFRSRTRVNIDNPTQPFTALLNAPESDVTMTRTSTVSTKDTPMFYGRVNAYDLTLNLTGENLLVGDDGLLSNRSVLVKLE